MFFKKTSLKDETAPPTYEQSLKKPYFSIFVLTRDSEKAKNSVHMAKRAKRSVVYFNPTQRNCPNFNPLAGEEADAIECIISSYHAGNPDLPVFFLEKGETLLRSSIKVPGQQHLLFCQEIDAHAILIVGGGKNGYQKTARKRESCNGSKTLMGKFAA